MFRNILLTSFVVCACACGGAIGNGNVITQQRPVSGFTHVTMDGSFNVTVREDPAFAVAVTTDSNLEDDVLTYVEGDTLIIREKPMGILTSTRLDVAVALPAFAGAELDGSGNFNVVNIQTARDVTLNLGGSGNLDFEGPALSVAASLTGSGRLRASGTATSLSADLSGSGSLDAQHLETQDGQLSLSGSGQLLATVERSIDLSLTGSGSIDWWGAASIRSVASDGSGSIAHH